MSILNMYSVHDAAALAYLQPFYARADGEALRNFMAAANDAKHVFCVNAKDFTLFHVGKFDELSGVVTPQVPHRPLGKAVDFKTAD